MTTPFISIEGPIGVGKTSLAKAISDRYGFELVQEIVEENPFLDKFYDNIEEWSFQTEMYFLCHRYKQLQDVEKHFLRHQQPVVSDYHIFKNKIFAQRTLQERERDKYLQIYDILTEDMPTPNLIIYLNASLDTLVQRIQLRGRHIEKNIDHVYLKQLSEDYATFMAAFKRAHPAIPVIEVDGDQLDFVTRQGDLNTILLHFENSLEKENMYEFTR
ncbi:deoxynucleoside kinase [Caldalkalibacillus salinus]|uniref:deoxynucleoside kinase n=1 Tax=Caldalkalibacillus salinus TaxID=2803787 RepID=UPI001922618A|nr:deoxynucleoside kinase [Caldalkalibacillus salinus]